MSGEYDRRVQLNASYIRASFFDEHVINAWSSLPDNTVDFNSVPIFRRLIYNVDFSRYFVCF